MSEKKIKGFAENPPIIRLEKITIENRHREVSVILL